MQVLKIKFQAFVAAMLVVAPYAFAEPSPLAPDGPLSAEEKSAFAAMLPPATKAIKLPPVPPKKAMAPILSNVSVLMGLPFTDRVKEGYAAFMKGDSERALALVEAGLKDAFIDLLKFRLSLMRADILARTDRIADAEGSLLDTAVLEDDVWGKTLLSRAVRGDVRARLGDEAAAVGDLARVALAQKGWVLRTDYDQVPDIADIAMNTEAKARASLGLASLYVRNGHYAKGLAWAVELEKHFARLFALADNGEFGDMVPLLPEFYLARGENLAYIAAGILAVSGETERAAPYFAAAEGFFEALGYTHGRAVTATLRARALYDIGRFDEFEAAAQPAIALAAEAGLGELVWRLEAMRGERFMADGKTGEAEKALRRAQTAVALVSGALASDQSKLRFGVGKERLTQLLVGVDLATGRHDNLFKDMEQGRARAFIDMLADQAIASGGEKALITEIRGLERDIRRQRLANTSMGADSAAGLERVRALLGQRAEAVVRLRQANSELADALSIAAVELDKVQASLKPGEVLAYAVPAAPAETIRWLLVEQSSARVVETTVSMEELAGLLQGLADAIDEGAAVAQQNYAASLADRLAVAQWGAAKGVYVVPAGQLYFVPWGTLDTSYFVAVLPMGGWLTRPPAQASNDARAAVVGDPAYFGKLKQLPGARAEATLVSDLYRAKALLGEDASEASLRQSVGNGIGVLHLATHATFDAENPLNSAVMLSGQGKVNRITAARLFEAPLRANLVVLSACETGVGRTVAGDDFLGLSRSFYLGGARTMLNSLWPVEDKGTKAFMVRFHELARNGDFGAAWLGARNEAKQKGLSPLGLWCFHPGRRRL